MTSAKYRGESQHFLHTSPWEKLKMRLLASWIIVSFGFICSASGQQTKTPLQPYFTGKAQSTGWIPFSPEPRSGIFIPATINGHPMDVLLVTGLPLSDIDQTFASSLDTADDKRNAGDVVHDLDIQIGPLRLDQTDAAVMDFGPLSRHTGRRVQFLLGDEVFKSLVVDIDFPHHRICFSKTSEPAIPANAVEVPLKMIDGLPLIPISIEGGAPVEVEMGIGNTGDALIYQGYYERQRLLESRRLSKRLAAGSGGITPEPIGLLQRLELAGFTFRDVPAAFISDALAGTKSDSVSGDLGLPVLSRFRLIVDYAKERLWMIPDEASLRKPFAQDRLGLWLRKDGSDLVVEFVAPGSPAEQSGLVVGEKITKINGRSALDWNPRSLENLRLDPKVRTVTLTLGSTKQIDIRLAKFF